MSDPEVLFQGRSLRAHGTGLDRRAILVTFDRRRDERQSFPDYRPVNRALNRGMGHLAIDTAANDWFMNGETAALVQQLRSYAADRSIIATGFSMGGFGAILFAAALRAQRLLLMAPQYSVLPYRAPFERRYRDEVARIDPAADLYQPPGPGGPGGLILYDPRLEPVDRRHAALILRDFPALRPVALPFGGHPPVRVFDKRTGYGCMMDAFLDDGLTPGLVRALHRTCRPASRRYRQHLRAYLLRRRRRGPPAGPAGAPPLAQAPGTLPVLTDLRLPPALPATPPGTTAPLAPDTGGNPAPAPPRAPLSPAA